MTMLKVKCSGAYLHGKEKVDFEETVVIPVCDEEWLKSNIIHRTLPRYFFNKKGAKRFDGNYSCYIDSEEEIEGESTAVGKNIMELSHEEIQEVAIMHSLRKVPKYKATDLKAAKKILYREYCNKLLNMSLSEDFDLNIAPDITIGDTITAEDTETEIQHNPQITPPKDRSQAQTKTKLKGRGKDKVSAAAAKLEAQLDEDIEI